MTEKVSMAEMTVPFHTVDIFLYILYYFLTVSNCLTTCEKKIENGSTMKKCISLPLFFLILVLASIGSLVSPQTASAEGCGGPVPPVPQGVWTKSGPKPGEITIYWKGAPHANRYAVAYGTWSNKYQYGAHNIGADLARSYTVSYLTPGTKYYFRLAAAQGCASSPFSTEVTGVAMGGLPGNPPKADISGQVMMKKEMSGPVGKQMLWVKSGPKTGEVTLYWKNNENADNYHLVYGTNSGKPEYGALNIGKVSWFTVRHLTPGKTYYFAIVPVMNNMAMYTTPFVSSAAYQPVQVVETTREALIQAPVVMTTPVVTIPPEVGMEKKETMVNPSVVVTGSGGQEATPSSPAGY